MNANGGSDRVTLRTLRGWAREGRPFPMLTCYDATTAGWLWRGGVRTLLVGDTAARFILGHDSTLPVSVSFMLEITAAVRRGAPGAFVMGDMPFGSYQAGEDRAVRNAARFLTRGMADAVKLEVDETFLPLVKRLTHAGIPVVAHLGSRPQQKRLQGGHSRTVFRSEGQLEAAAALAREMVEAGAVTLLFEAVPAELIDRVLEITAAAGPDGGPVPLLGCGAGPRCHGHVVVLQDLLGLTTWQPPFAPPLAQLGAEIEGAARRWAEIVETGQYLRRDHPYQMGR